MKQAFIVRIRLFLVLLATTSVARFGLAQEPVTVTLMPNMVTAGESAIGMAGLNGPAYAQETITLSSNTLGVSVPASVTIPTGKQAAQFTVNTSKSLANVTAVISASQPESGSVAVGFMFVQQKVVPNPGFASVAINPLIDFGQAAKGVITFTQPLVAGLTLDHSSSSTNFTVPASVNAPVGATSVSFPVTPTASAPTSQVSVSVSLASEGAWTGSTTASGTFAFVAGVTLPPNHQPGFWVSDPVPESTSMGTSLIYTINAHPDGRVEFGLLAYGLDHHSVNVYTEEQNCASGHLDGSGN